MVTIVWCPSKLSPSLLCSSALLPLHPSFSLKPPAFTRWSKHLYLLLLVLCLQIFTVNICYCKIFFYNFIFNRLKIWWKWVQVKELDNEFVQGQGQGINEFCLPFFFEDLSGFSFFFFSLTLHLYYNNQTINFTLSLCHSFSITRLLRNLNKVFWSSKHQWILFHR